MLFLHHSLRYLNMLLTNKCFAEFQKQAAKQLKQPDLWTKSSWAILQLFQFFNFLFDIEKIDQKIAFIEDNVLRKTLGHMRLWIDLQRIYLLCFLRLDRINFTQTRIYMSIFRTLKFFSFFFSQYEFTDFKKIFIDQLRHDGIDRIKYLRECSSEQYYQMLDKIIRMFQVFIENRYETQSNQQLAYQKRAFQKITQQYSSIGQVERRLSFNIDFLEKERTRREVAKIDKLEMPFQGLEAIFDPQQKLVSQFKKNMEKTGEHFDQQKVKAMVQDYKKKTNNRKIPQNVYTSLMKIGHNPYGSDNFRIYGELLGIDISKKRQLQQVQLKSAQKTVKDDKKLVYYDQSFIQQINTYDIKSSAVTRSDLADDNIANKGLRNWQGILLNDKISNAKWTYSNQNSRSTRRTKDFPTKDSQNNLQMNAILKDEEEQELQLLRINFFKKLIKKHRSGTMNHISQRATQYTQAPNIYPFNRQKKKSLLMLHKKAIKTHDKLQYLRQVNTYSVVQSKLKSILMEKQVPDYYPRTYKDIQTKSADICKHHQRVKGILDLKFHV